MGDPRPGLLEGARAHEKANMPARNQFLLDHCRRCAEIFDRVEDLLRRGDVVRFAGKEVDGTDDVFEIKTPTEPDKVALGQPVLLEQLDRSEEHTSELQSR